MRNHPVHPPLTDIVIGAFAVASVLAIVSALGIAERAAASGWWLALVVGVIASVPTAAAGFFDWLRIPAESPAKRVGVLHLLAVVTADLLMLAALLVGHDGYVDETVETVPLVLTLAGMGVLLVGGWLGGSLVFEYGTRVRED